MQFRDLKIQYQKLKDEIDNEVLKVMRDTNFIMGSQVESLEKDLANYVGVKHCITCGNGTDALQLAAMAIGIGKGDAVFVPDFTFFASGEIVSLLGATPVFVDVDKRTYNMDYKKLEKKIGDVIKDGELNPKAVVAVDLFGLPADHININKIADKYELTVIEDGAQGFGGKIADKRACSFTKIGTTSFFPAKPLGCYGDGGAIFTDSDEFANIIKSYRIHGKGDNKYDNVRIGLNSRLDTIQAAILNIKFKAFREYELNAVNSVAQKYDDNLKDICRLVLPHVPDQYLSSWAQYTIQLENKQERDGLQEYLRNNDIPSMVYYPKPMSTQYAFSNCTKYLDDLNVTKKLCDTVLSLPMHPYLEDEQIARICQTIMEYTTNHYE